MGMPIACYAMGAPAERVGPYNRGLVLNKIAPRENLNQIINFIKSGYKNISSSDWDNYKNRIENIKEYFKEI